MEVLFLTRYDRKGASSRIRALKYFPGLRAEGIRCTYQPLFSDRYLTDLFERGRRNLTEVMRGYLYRLFDILRAGSYDLIVLENEVFPYVPAYLERLLSNLGISYIVDIDDAIFHNYDRSSNPLVRNILSRKIDVVMKNAEVVVAGNEYIASRAERAGASKVEIIPTPIDLGRYPDDQPVPEEEQFTIGWIGSPSTAEYLHKIAPALREICEQRSTQVRLIGSGEVHLEGVDYEIREWSENTEVENLLDIDVGIMPLENSAWERGKCGFKLIQYMGAWKPVVASPVGMNVNLVRQGNVGMLADTENEWISALRTLAEDPERRLKMGKRGRKKVERSFCFDVTTPQWADILRRIS